MATSTFHGLEVARRALATQQFALHTTSHNISNANTEGYSRQRVNFEASQAFPMPARNAPQMSGQLGTGVEAGQIERIRDQFLDFQYRAENNQAGYYESKAEALKRMEDIMNESSDSGLASTMDQFWESIQDVATNPEDGGARRVMQQRGQAVAETFHHLHEKLTDVQGELKNQMDTNAGQVNTLVNQIQQINDQISRVEPNGDLPNDLYDRRDVLIDELSQHVNIDVSYESNGGHSKASAEGQAIVTLVDNNRSDIEGGTLIDAENNMRGLEIQFNGENDEIVSGVGIGPIGEDGEVDVEQTIEASNFNSPGKLQGLIHANGYDSGETDDGDNPIYAGDYVEMIDGLNQMAHAFVNEFNAQHEQGYDLNGDEGVNFFNELESSENAAASISVSDAILNDENLIAASGTGHPGDGSNARALSDVRDENIDELGGQSTQKYYEALIGDLGVKAQEANRMAQNTSDLRESVNNNRESISGVSLDEEMSNMIKFQHAYNAAARSMTVVDETLDRVINQMGIVGR
ncbi:flagellar hook-associated protein FlgK [Alkalibacillus haloalkaliphilus]|uniref:flagellar hook-associated protein FlgK n=1 Tax=Alkalibacillus haloalkaliphilus TaxID=94136 RepID=UPI0002F9372C|nr:flagellar hook-associated protein FlgK [Alkalibacillus haloalkaliphilus]